MQVKSMYQMEKPEYLLQQVVKVCHPLVAQTPDHCDDVCGDVYFGVLETFLPERYIARMSVSSPRFIYLPSMLIIGPQL